jgi:hypothetical protein
MSALLTGDPPSYGIAPSPYEWSQVMLFTSNEAAERSIIARRLRHAGPGQQCPVAEALGTKASADGALKI